MIEIQEDIVSRDPGQHPCADAQERSPRILNVGPKPSRRGVVVNLRSLGYSGYVSEAARAELEAADRRAMLVVSTAHRFWFR